MTFVPRTPHKKTAFGSLLISEIVSYVRILFNYGLNPLLVKTRENNSGSTSESGSQAIVSTGAASNSFASIASRSTVKYQPGQGGIARFTGLFTNGVAGSEQVIGLGDIYEGYFFGYSGSDFGILRRRGGAPETRTLEITTPSTTDESITITLDGENTVVAVTNNGDVTETANEIAAGDYSQVGSGWFTDVVSSSILFFSYDASGFHSGTYAISGTTASGSYSQTISGSTPTDFFVSQSAWNKDKADGTDRLPVMDFTKGNVFEIAYQYLGYGSISFLIEEPESGDFVEVHKTEYANANTVPSLVNPSLPLCMHAKNTSNSTNIELKSASWFGGTQGQIDRFGVRLGTSTTLTGLGTTVVPLVTIKNKTVFNGRLNRDRAKITFVSISNDHNQASLVSFYSNATVVSSSFSDAKTGASLMQIGDNGSSFSGGDILFSVLIGAGDAQIITIEDPDNAILNPGDSITAVGAAVQGVGADITVAINWVEFI